MTSFVRRIAARPRLLLLVHVDAYDTTAAAPREHRIVRASLPDVRQPDVEQQRPVEVLQRLVIEDEVQRPLSRERLRHGPDGVSL